MATVSFNIPDAEVPRVRAMILAALPSEDADGNPITYTNAELMQEFKNRIKTWVKSEVQQYELLAAREDLYNQYTPIPVED